jgi:hypothetical protein
LTTRVSPIPDVRQGPPLVIGYASLRKVGGHRVREVDKLKQELTTMEHGVKEVISAYDSADYLKTE